MEKILSEADVEKEVGDMGQHLEGAEAFEGRPRTFWMRWSKHLSHIEARLMEGEYLGHDVARQIIMPLLAAVPYPRGDWGVAAEGVTGHRCEDGEAALEVLHEGR